MSDLLNFLLVSVFQKLMRPHMLWGESSAAPRRVRKSFQRSSFVLVVCACEWLIPACAPISAQNSNAKNSSDEDNARLNTDACVPYLWSENIVKTSSETVRVINEPFWEGLEASYWSEGPGARLNEALPASTYGPYVNAKHSEKFTNSLIPFLHDHNKNYKNINGVNLSMAKYLNFRSTHDFSSSEGGSGNYTVSPTLKAAIEEKENRLFAWCLRPRSVHPWYDLRYEKEKKFRLKLALEVQDFFLSVKRAGGFEHYFRERSLSYLYSDSELRSLQETIEGLETEYLNIWGVGQVLAAWASVARTPGFDKVFDPSSQGLLYEESRSLQAGCEAIALTSTGVVGKTIQPPPINTSRAVWLYAITARKGKRGAGKAFYKCLQARLRNWSSDSMSEGYRRLLGGIFQGACGMALTAEEHDSIRRFWENMAEWHQNSEAYPGFAFRGHEFSSQVAKEYNYFGEVPFYLGFRESEDESCGPGHSAQHTSSRVGIAHCKTYVSNFLGVSNSSGARSSDRQNVMPFKENFAVFRVFEDLDLSLTGSVGAWLEFQSATKKDIPATVPAELGYAKP